MAGGLAVGAGSAGSAGVHGGRVVGGFAEGRGGGVPGRVE